MSLETRAYTKDDFPHINMGDMIVMDRTHLELPKYSADELTKEYDALSRDLTQLYHTSRGSEGGKMIVGLAGVLGVGKTTIASKIKGWAHIVKLEEKAESPGLNLLYANGGKTIFGFPYQFYVGIQRAALMTVANRGTPSAVIDRTWPEDAIFAKNFYDIGALTDKQLSHILNYLRREVSRHKQPDIIVSLEASDDIIENRVSERNRAIEMAGATKTLTEQEIMEMLLVKDRDIPELLERYAPSELREYRMKLVDFSIPREIIFEGASPKYIVGLNRAYKGLASVLHHDFNYSGIILNLDVNPKEGIDVRENERGHIPIMRALKEASILTLLREGYRVKERSDGEGLEITAPWRVNF